MGKRSVSTRVLVAGGGIVAAIFFVIAFYAGLTFWRARRAAVESSANALPSVQLLTDARSDVRLLNAAMEEALLDAIEGQPIVRPLLEGHRQRLEGHLRAYRAQPMYPGESEKIERMLASLAWLDRTQDHMIQLVGTHDWPSIHKYENGEWRIANDQLDDSLQVLIDLNTTQLAKQLLHLDQISTISIIVLSVASLLWLGIASLAIGLAVRNIRLYERSMEARAAEWEIFSGRLAHDLMSPLQVVGLALSANPHEDARAAKITARGVAALGRVREITDALLNFARAGGTAIPGERAPIQEVIGALFDELRPYADEQHVELVLEPVPSAEVNCSGGMLSIMLSNLLRNAIKHMGDRPVRRVTLKSSLFPERIRFEVHDTGPGLDPVAARHVFQPFVRKAAPGVAGIGLGLATVKRTVEAYGGAVGVRSVERVGSVFWAELPLATAKSNHHVPPQPSAFPA
jgi:signal transduction histidine kinase